jgi:hypothetical protein
MVRPVIAFTAKQAMLAALAAKDPKFALRLGSHVVDIPLSIERGKGSVSLVLPEAGRSIDIMPDSPQRAWCVNLLAEGLVICSWNTNGYEEPLKIAAGDTFRLDFGGEVIVADCPEGELQAA